MGKMFKRKSVLYTWCLSYGLLLLMMVVMCIMLGRNARNQLISEYKSITQTLQKQSNNAINDYFDELERCAYEISNDYLVNDFVSTARNITICSPFSSLFRYTRSSPAER